MKPTELPVDLQIFVGKAIHMALDERDRRCQYKQGGGNLTDVQVYIGILGLFGLECPHPLPLSGRGVCRMCDSLILRSVE